MVVTRARKIMPISSTDVRFTQKIIVHLKATMSCIIYNHTVTNLTILCGFCGPKTTKNSPKSKISVFGKILSKNCHKIVTADPIDIILVPKESSRGAESE